MKKHHYFLLIISMLFCSVSHSEIKTSVQAQGLSFLSPDYDNTSTKNFGFIGATLRSDAKSKDAFKLNFTGQYAIGNSVLSYLNFREIYFAQNIDESSNLYIGRKLHNWSALDTIWNMGVYQPQFRWNPLAPENQGLTGLFWNKKTESFSFTLFASPLYIPDQGASYELKDGQFQSSNPWFQPPPQHVLFQNVLLPIDYEINKPEISSVVFQSQFGAQLRWSHSDGYFANIGAMYKPANQLALGYKGVLVTTRVRVDVTPKIFFENIYSGDFGYRGDWGVLQLAVLHSQPKNPEFDSSFNVPVYESSTSWGPQLFYKWDPFEFFVGYLDTTGGNVVDVGPDASADRQSLSQRFLYRQALLLQASYSEIFWNKVKLDASLQFKSSSKEGFRQIRSKNSFNLRGPWAFWFDLLLIDTDSSIPTNIESYKNVDQVLIGVNYDI